MIYLLVLLILRTGVGNEPELHAVPFASLEAGQADLAKLNAAPPPAGITSYAAACVAMPVKEGS